MDLTTEGYIRLMAATIIQAAKDVRRGDDRAAYWLRNDGIDWFEFITRDRMDPEYWEAWIRAGCPGRGLKRHASNYSQGSDDDIERSKKRVNSEKNCVQF
jgi:hypothetical protein